MRFAYSIFSASDRLQQMSGHLILLHESKIEFDPRLSECIRSLLRPQGSL